jgi:hypothetical protein
MKKNPVDVDEARLRPHLRSQKPPLFVMPDNGAGYVQTFNGPGMPRARDARYFKPEPGDLRGIPVQGKGVGGAMDGTRPDTSRINRAA